MFGCSGDGALLESGGEQAARSVAAAVKQMATPRGLVCRGAGSWQQDRWYSSPLPFTPDRNR